MVIENPAQPDTKKNATIYKLPNLELSRDFDVEAAAKYLLEQCAHHLRDNFQRYCENKDEAVLMQIRIGMRRIRVVMKAFKRVIKPAIYKDYKKEFRYFGRLLGEARDLDVILRGMLEDSCPVKDLEVAYEELRSRTQQMRDDEYNKNHQELTNGKFEDQLRSFEQWRSGDWFRHLDPTGAALLKSPVDGFAIDVIKKGKRKLLKHGAFIDALSVDELHTLRKYVKQSRYHLRFFSSLFDHEKISDGYQLLAQMQDSLGYVNDVREGLKLMTSLSSEVRADHISNTLRLMAVIVQKAGEEIESHLDSFSLLWHRYETFEITYDDLR